MNREETQEAIKVMQAYVDGAEIQWQGGITKKWRDFEDDDFPKWTWSHEAYRIKPKPREFWIKASDLPKHGGFGVNAYVTNTQGNPTTPFIKVREVIE